MKSGTGLLPNRISLIAILAMCIISLPNLSFAQKKEITLTYDCVEYIGDGSGRYSVSFGYENTDSKTVVVEESNSVVTYNHGQSKKYGSSTFLPGKHEKVFTQEFSADDRVVWEVRMPNNKIKTVSADINSNHCRDTEERIIPYYTPPPGGKLTISKIGAELNSLYEKSVSEGNNFHPVSDDIFQINESLEVFVEVVAQNGKTDELVSELNGLIPLLASSSDFLHFRATYWFPTRRLIELNDLIYLNYARPVFTGINDKIDGQGDIAMRSDYTRKGFLGMGNDPDNPFSLDGSGVRVGIISNSYNTKGTADLDVDQEDLPGAANENGYTKDVAVLKDIITPQGLSLSDEGRAMMQIVHDVAPGAELVFRTGYLGELDMAQGIRELANPNLLFPEAGDCDIIVDDITYITEPFFRDGIISKAIDDVVDNNSVSYFSSAGNFGNYSYQDVYLEGSPLPGVDGVPHNFGDEISEDILQLISLDKGTYTLVLQWDDGTDADQAVTNTDLDIFLTHDDGTTLFGFNRVNIGGAPVEVLPFTVLEDDVFTNILITKVPGPDNNNIAFKYVVFRGGAGFHFEEEGHDVGSSTIVGHANAEGTIAVGAVRYHHTPAYGELLVVEDFSSIGGSPIMTHTTAMPISSITRDKPDFTAPDGVNTSIDLSSDGNSDYEGDLLPNFFGTSAAAPHAAGATALIIQARRSFDNGNNTAPGDIRNLLRNTAIGNAGQYSPVSGYGFIQPYAAIRTFANPKPEIDEILYPDNVTPGASLDSLTFTLKGNFYIDEENPDEHTKIHFRGEELSSGVVIQDEQTIVVTHSFLGNPAIQAVNPPSLNGGPISDGGSSDPIFFSTTPKIPIVITARSFEKKFGENLPDLSQAILEDSDPDTYYNASIDFTDFAPGEKERIRQRLSFDVKATTSSGVATYDILLNLADPDPDEELDHAISEKYEIIREQGYLIIKKLSLKITPKPTTIGYGQVLTQDSIEFIYEVDSEIVEDTILADLNRKYTNPIPIGVPMVNGIALVRGTALVNNPDGDIIRIEVDEEDGEITLYVKIEGSDDFVLCNMAGPLPRGIALVNGQPFVQIEEIVSGVGMYNGDDITIVRENGISYMTGVGTVQLDEPIAIENGIALVRGIALVNGVYVEVTEIGGEPTTMVNGEIVRGIALVNGIPIIRGTALVNSAHIIRGTALVNGIEVPVTSGIPDVGVNGINPRGIALVNGIPLIRGTALVNDLNIEITDSGIIKVGGEELNSFTNGIALVRGTALVNGLPVVRGIALVNGKALVRGIALVNDAPAVDILDNMNFLASTNSLDYLSFVNGNPLVNDMQGIDGANLSIAATANPDVEFNYAKDIRGIALVNGRALVRGTALVNGIPLVRGTALVNTQTINDDNNYGAIAINHEAEESSSYVPVTFITGTDAGTHSIIPGTFLSDNFDISYGLGELTIEKAELSITATENQSKIYGQANSELTIQSYTLDGVPNDQEFDGTVGDVNLYGNDALTGSLLRTEGENAGSYLIEQGSLKAGDNYVLTLIENGATFTIKKAPLTITADPVSKTYGEPDSQYPLTFTLGEFDLQFDDEVTDAVSGDLSRETGEDVHALGYDILGGDLVAGNNYYIDSYFGAKFYINKASLTITAEINGKDYGEPDPILTIESYMLDGVLNEPDFDGSVRDVDLYYSDMLTGSLSYIGGEAVGSHSDAIGKGTLAITDSNGNILDGNYGLSVISSMFYINPSGPGTRAVKPVLNCVRDIGGGIFEANFSYSNENETPVFIPVGLDNLILGSGLDEDYLQSVQPVVFLPGGPLEEIMIIFDGNELSWSISSRDDEKKASNAANANSSSTKCKKEDLKSASIAAEIVEDELDPDYLNAYPNPVTDKVHITMKDIEHYKMIQLYDMTGRQHSITSIHKRSDNLEIDMAQLSPGYYIFKIVMEDSSRVVQVIKE